MKKVIIMTKSTAFILPNQFPYAIIIKWAKKSYNLTIIAFFVIGYGNLCVGVFM